MLVVSPIMSGIQDRERLQELILARRMIDRSSHLRTDPEILENLWSRAEVLTVVGQRLHASDSALIFRSASEFSGKASGNGERYFLGIDHQSEKSYFAWHSDEEILPDAELRTLRQIGADLGAVEAELAVHAIALSQWHSSHPRCSRCGGVTRPDMGGALRVCEVDGSQHYPRTDPAIIVLVRDKEDRIALGRQNSWAPNRFSNFAGFVEPGESFEQCVLREVEEESGLELHSIGYLGSQPWPFPASIMVACEAIAADPAKTRPDGEEIVEIRWFSRQEMKDAINTGELALPPRISVSRRMIEYWYGKNAAEDLGLGGWSR